MSEITGIEQAIAIAGSQGELASWLGISRQAISRWHQKGEVPSDRADLVADLTGVPAWRLCPRFRRNPVQSSVAEKEAREISYPSKRRK